MKTTETGKSGTPAGTLPPTAANLDQDAQVRFINLKAWRAEVVREHGLPAYVIFHDATLAAIAQQCLRTVQDLQGDQRHGGEEAGGLWGGGAAGVWAVRAATQF